MEEQRVFGKIRIGIGLLITIFSVWAAPSQTPQDIRALRVSPAVSGVYAGTECQFSLIIPEANPSDVQAETPSLPPEVSFISMRRTGYIKDGVQAGTEIDVWLKFSTAKEYSLPPLKVTIRSRSYSIPFDSLSVLQDPSTMLPVFVLRFDNGTEVTGSQKITGPLFTVSAGDSVRFTVFVQYAVNVMNLEWTVPKDSLLTQTVKYEPAAGTAQNGRVSTDRMPVARFEWQPLTPGTAAVPGMHCTASAYSGSRVVLSQPAVRITVVRGEKKTSQAPDHGEDYFAYAFTETSNGGTPELRPSVSGADCARLAVLRSRERNVLFQRKSAAERRAFEVQIGISDGFNEPSVPLFKLVLLGVAAGVLGALVLFLLKKRNAAGVCAGAAFALCVVAVLLGRQVYAEYGIYKGGSIHSVPDESPVSYRLPTAGSG